METQQGAPVTKRKVRRRTAQELDTARAWMLRNARPLDMARWQYHFAYDWSTNDADRRIKSDADRRSANHIRQRVHDAAKESALSVLATYQNPDGGFGHALEADCWSPYSTPIQTCCAVELLCELRVENANNPIIQGILRYLDSGQDFVDNKWLGTVPGNNDYPHAQWWTWRPDTIPDDNPTATLAAFAVRFAQKDSPLYQKALLITKEIADAFLQNPTITDGHLLLCYLRMYTFCSTGNTIDHFDSSAFYQKLTGHIADFCQTAKPDWCCDGVLRQFINAYYGKIPALVSRERREELAVYLSESMQPDGTWAIPWHWQEYPEQWAVTQNWWRAHGVISNLMLWDTLTSSLHMW